MPPISLNYANTVGDSLAQVGRTSMGYGEPNEKNRKLLLVPVAKRDINGEIAT